MSDYGVAFASSAFWRAVAVRRDLRRFSEQCEPAYSGLLSHWAAQYRHPRRVLVIDARCQGAELMYNGVGNLSGDYLHYFLWGVASDRAVFIRFTDCDSVHEPVCNRLSIDEAASDASRLVNHSRHAPYCNRADLGRHFGIGSGSEAGSHAWEWSDATRTLVSSSLFLAHPSVLLTSVPATATASSAAASHERTYRLLLHGRESNGSPSALPATRAVNYSTFYQEHLLGASPWVEVRISDGGGQQLWHGFRKAEWTRLALTLATQRAHRSGTARVSPQAAPTPDVSQPQQAGQQSARQQEVWQPQDPAHPAAELHAPVALESCLLHAVLRPRATLAAALLPTVRKLSHTRGFVVVHARTGWADDLYRVPEEVRDGRNASAIQRAAVGAAERMEGAEAAEGVATMGAAATQAAELRAGGRLAADGPKPLLASRWPNLNALCERMGGLVANVTFGSSSAQWAVLSVLNRASGELYTRRMRGLLEKCATLHEVAPRGATPHGAAAAPPHSLGTKRAEDLASPRDDRVGLPGMESGGLATLFACGARLAQGVALAKARREAETRDDARREETMHVEAGREAELERAQVTRWPDGGSAAGNFTLYVASDAPGACVLDRAIEPD